MMRKLVLAGFVLPFAFASANAASITPSITHTAGAAYTTSALTGYTTTNADMVGSLVTVTFSDGSTDAVTWTATGAVGSGWSLTESGDTYTAPWTFSNTGTLSVTSFAFNGVTGDTAFDIVTGVEDSPGSNVGKPMSSVTGPAGLSVSALYPDQLEVGGTFYGDEYTKMVVSFGGAGLTSGNSLSYVTDTDSAVSAAVGGGISAVPEPASWAMMVSGFGLIGLGMRRRTGAPLRQA